MAFFLKIIEPSIPSNEDFKDERKITTVILITETKFTDDLLMNTLDINSNTLHLLSLSDFHSMFFLILVNFSVKKWFK